MSGFLAVENARASTLLAYVRDYMPDTGDQITYTEVLDLLEMNDVDPKTVGSVLSGVVAVVNKRLHRDGDHRHLSNIATVGYCIGTPARMREEVISRMRAVDRQMVANLRLTEKIVRHPDATTAERKRAADAAAAQAALLSMVRRDQRRVRAAWPAEETSPVLTGDVV